MELDSGAVTKCRPSALRSADGTKRRQPTRHAPAPSKGAKRGRGQRAAAASRAQKKNSRATHRPQLSVKLVRKPAPKKREKLRNFLLFVAKSDVDFRTARAACKPLVPSPYAGPHSNVAWWCHTCAELHSLVSCRAAAPFFSRHGFRWMSEADGVMEDGDCFYASVARSFCLRAGREGDEFVFPEVSVPTMRGWVADAMGMDQLDFYRAMAAADTNEAWLDFLRKPSATRRRMKRHRKAKASRASPKGKKKNQKQKTEAPAATPTAVATASASGRAAVAAAAARPGTRSSSRVKQRSGSKAPSKAPEGAKPVVIATRRSARATRSTRSANPAKEDTSSDGEFFVCLPLTFHANLSLAI